MFESACDAVVPDRCATVDEDWFDPAWSEQIPAPEDVGQVLASECAPSGWLALELDHATADPARLPDADLIDTIVGFDRVSSWASARQARLLAEFARRRPGDHPLAARSDAPSLCSEFAPDEIGLALRLSRTAATARLSMAQTLADQLPGTLTAWEAGVIDERRARAITESSYLLPSELHGALETRVLSRAGTQTVARLRASLARAVLALNPHGAAARHEQRRQDRRVVVGPDGDGMATLWALLSAPDATAAYQRLCELARGLGAEDPRGMDARRADLLVELLTGRRCAATSDCTTPDCDGDCGDSTDALTTDTADSPPAASGCAGCGTAGAGDAVSSGSSGGPVASGSSGGPVSRGRPVGSRGPGKPLVSVLVPITMLMGLDDQPGELAGYGPIPAPLAREIAAGGTWRRLLTDPASGALLDYGRTTYTPPDGLADFVRARDVSCRHPGCGQRAATADLDHTIAWDDGGTTSADNLHASCRRHHRLKTHVPGWRIDQHPEGQITWTTPTGHTYRSHPHDYRPDPGRDPLSGRYPPGHDPPEDDRPPPF